MGGKELFFCVLEGDLAFFFEFWGQEGRVFRGFLSKIKEILP